jgi:hypothetical protein
MWRASTRARAAASAGSAYTKFSSDFAWRYRSFLRWPRPVEDIVALVEVSEPKPSKRGPYKVDILPPWHASRPCPCWYALRQTQLATRRSRKLKFTTSADLNFKLRHSQTDEVFGTHRSSRCFEFSQAALAISAEEARVRPEGGCHGERCEAHVKRQKNDAADAEDGERFTQGQTLHRPNSQG